MMYFTVKFLPIFKSIITMKDLKNEAHLDDSIYNEEKIDSMHLLSYRYVKKN